MIWQENIGFKVVLPTVVHPAMLEVFVANLHVTWWRKALTMKPRKLFRVCKTLGSIRYTS
jgi:hypothetical protein